MVARHCQCEGLVADAVAGERQLGEQQHLGTAGPGGGDHLQMFRQIGGDVAMTRLDLRDGEQNGAVFWGGSRVLDPSGNTLAPAGAGEELIFAALAFQAVLTAPSPLPTPRA